MANREAYDNLCDKLEPYVAITVPLLSEKELADFIAKSAQDKAALKEVLEEEEPDETMRKSLEGELSSLFDAPEPYALRTTQIKVATELIATSWSEALRWVYKEQGEVQLRDYLLPDNLGSGRASWDLNLSLFGLNQAQIEDLLRNFGEKEIPDSIDLPWGGYVQRVVDGYELRGSKQDH